MLTMHSDLVNSKLKGPAKKFELSKDNTIIKSLGYVDDFKFTKFHCILKRSTYRVD